ncbi:hypothetical protein NL676_036901 [Syzygium grande]|nr:hypothetical protein NL676_036901 [Syzygium grande]
MGNGKAAGEREQIDGLSSDVILGQLRSGTPRWDGPALQRNENGMVPSLEGNEGDVQSTPVRLPAFASSSAKSAAISFATFSKIDSGEDAELGVC